MTAGPSSNFCEGDRQDRSTWTGANDRIIHRAIPGRAREREMSELEAVAHGRGDRATYYDKWAKVADDSVAEVEASESAERDAAAAALGTEKHPRSAAEAEKIEKRAALKEAKKKWSEREAADTLRSRTNPTRLSPWEKSMFVCS